VTKPLPTDKRPHIALLVETTLASGREILRGVARYARRKTSWSFFHIPGDMKLNFSAWRKTWHGDGVIAKVSDHFMIDELQSMNIPVIDVLGKVVGAKFPLIHTDDAAIGRMAFEHLHAIGMRQFAFVGVESDEPEKSRDWSARRRDAFCASADASGMTVAVLEMDPLALESESWEARQKQIGDWLLTLPKPIGIMVCSDQRGFEILEACRSAGIHVPTQAAVVGVDNDRPLCDICNPPMSSIWPNHFSVGYQAAALLDWQLKHGTEYERPLLISPRRLVVRESSNLHKTGDLVLQNAIQVIERQSHTGISIEEIAHAVGVSRTVLQRRFHTELRTTIHDQITSSKLRRAIDLIATTDLPLTKVAELCGFSNQQYMGVVFKKRLGRTPSQYR
jgi:LacI family transcriptional regulator